MWGPSTQYILKLQYDKGYQMLYPFKLFILCIYTFDIALNGMDGRIIV